MRKFFSYIFIAPAIVLITFFLGSLSLVCSLLGVSENKLHNLAQFWARVLLRASFVQVETEGLQHLDRKRNYVIVANHASFMDVPVIMANVPLQIRFFAKYGLFRIPLLGTHLGRAGHFPVHRDNARASLKSVGEAAKAIAQRHVSVLLFPEGGRTAKGLRDFQEGAAFLALKAGVPVLPIGLIGMREVLPIGCLDVRPAKVRLRIGEVVETSGMTNQDRQQLTELLRQRVADLAGEEVPNPVVNTAA